MSVPYCDILSHFSVSQDTFLCNDVRDTQEIKTYVFAIRQRVPKTAAAIYSLRRVNKSYTGSAIKVRRNTDYYRKNIGFDARGNLDEEALKAFVGPNDGFVETIYDQSGNGVDITNITKKNQPIIVTRGTILKVNNLPAVGFGGANHVLQSKASLNSPTKHLFVFMVLKPYKKK